MAINNYGDLKSAVTAALFHSRFIPRYDNAVLLFEEAANNRLRLRQMETATSLTTVAGQVTLPADYLLWRTVLHGSSPQEELDYVHPAYLDSTDTDAQIFTIEGNQFKARPIDDAANAYDFHYYRKVSSLLGSDANSNWLLLASPSSYLFGVLTELFAHGRNREAAELYKARRDESFAEIIKLSSLTTGATSRHVRETEEYY